MRCILDFIKLDQRKHTGRAIKACCFPAHFSELRAMLFILPARQYPARDLILQSDVLKEILEVSDTSQQPQKMSNNIKLVHPFF